MSSLNINYPKLDLLQAIQPQVREILQSTISTREDMSPLHLPSLPISAINITTLQLVLDMEATIGTPMDGIRALGLAAPQVGVNKRVILISHKGKYLAMINPVITTKSTRMLTGVEGCLSLGAGNIPYKVQRHRSISVSFNAVDGTTHEMKLAKGAAAIVQHEIDHLDGVLISDIGERT